MKTHIARVHEGKKPFKCGICDYRFSVKGDVKKHVTAVHEEKKNCSNVTFVTIGFQQSRT